MPLEDPAAPPHDPAPLREQGDPAHEARLVRAVQRGDAAAYDQLVALYLRRAYAVALRLLGHREDAEDLVQEAFLVALDRIDTFETGRAFGPWFYRILTNRGLNARRARARRVTEPVPDSAAAAQPSPAAVAEHAERRDRLRSALHALPERQRMVVELFELEGFRSPEIAEMLGISDATVRWHLHRARQALREALAPFADRHR